MAQAFLPSTSQTAEIQTVPTKIPERESVQIQVIGSAKAIHSVIHLLHVLHFAEAGAWTPLLPTGKPGRFMRCLIKRIL